MVAQWFVLKKIFLVNAEVLIGHLNIQNFGSSKLPFEVKLLSVFGKIYKR